jgi:transposase-like protein
VLELLQNESTLVQIASKHNILPQNLQNWKKTFLANAEIASFICLKKSLSETIVINEIKSANCAKDERQ